MQWYTTKRAYSGGKEIPIGTQGEGEVPAHLVGKVAVLVVATPQTESDPELDLTDRKQIAEKLKVLGIEFDGRKSAAELAELLPKE